MPSENRSALKVAQVNTTSAVGIFTFLANGSRITFHSACFCPTKVQQDREDGMAAVSDGCICLAISMVYLNSDASVHAYTGFYAGSASRLLQKAAREPGCWLHSGFERGVEM